ncbi:hypothetical protein B0J14DRAFT_571176 [Halenospora varia]|nr:hypothetical protein B0J14DRAFT_571176 [Halenospora varia]
MHSSTFFSILLAFHVFSFGTAAPPSPKFVQASRDQSAASPLYERNTPTSCAELNGVRGKCNGTSCKIRGANWPCEMSTSCTKGSGGGDNACCGWYLSDMQSVTQHVWCPGKKD